jgi:hypothetical protein
MSTILQKLGAEKVKHHLEVEIHYIRLKLPNPGQLLIEVQRGKKMHKETQPMHYSPEAAFLQFDYPIGFDITMHKKGSKYVKKNFVIILYQVDGKSRTVNGKVKIDFSQIPMLKKPIIRREVPLQHCSDPLAVVSISVKLEQLAGKGKTSAQASPNTSMLSPNSSLVEPDTKPKPKEKKAYDPLAVRPGSVKEPAAPVPVEVVVETDVPYHSEERNSSVDSRMSFSDLILNPKDSEVSSESSSSEEEVKELPKERLVAHAIPKTTRAQVTPNEASKADVIARVEEKGGISTRREGNCCNACEVV